MTIDSYIKQIRQNGKRCFSLKNLVSDLKISETNALNMISSKKEQKDIISPSKGFYVIVPPEHQSQGSIPPEELIPLLMKHLNLDYYVSLLSGARFYGASHQKPAKFQVVTNKRIKHPLDFGKVKIEIIYKKSLEKLPIKDFTVSTGYLKVATPELIAYDLFCYKDKSGGLNHIATVLSELIEAIDSEKLIALANTINENAWLQRLGFILEQIETMDDDKKLLIIKSLESYLSNKKLLYVPLASEIPKKGFNRIKKWKIIANTEIESDL